MEWKWRLIWFCPLSGHSALTDLIIITKPLKPQVSFSSKRRYETHLYSLHAKTTHVKKYLWWGVSSPAVWSSWPHQLSFTPFLKLMVFCIKLKKKGLENVSGGGGGVTFWTTCKHGTPHTVLHLSLRRFVRRPFCFTGTIPVLLLLCWTSRTARHFSVRRRGVTHACDSLHRSSVAPWRVSWLECGIMYLCFPPLPPPSSTVKLPAGNCVKKPTLLHFSFVFSLCGCLQVKSAKCKAFKATLEVQSD